MSAQIVPLRPKTYDARVEFDALREKWRHQPISDDDEDVGIDREFDSACQSLCNTYMAFRVGILIVGGAIAFLIGWTVNWLIR